MRAVLIVSGVVNNAIAIDEEHRAEYEAALPQGTTLVVSDTANIGDLYDGSTFTKPGP